MIRETPPVGAINPSAAIPPVPQKSDLGFYSALEQAAIPLQNKGTGSQYLAQLQKTPGVKPEELKWTGLEGFLGSRQNVTKQEIQDYLAANRVDLQEVRLGEDQLVRFERLEREKLSQMPDQQLADQVGIPYSGIQQERFATDPEFRQRLINDYIEGQVDYFRGNPWDLGQDYGSKFSKWTIPGGENYREILLTLPQKNVSEVRIAEQNRDMLAKQTADLMEEWKNLSEQMPGDPRVVNLYQQLAETRRMRDQAVVDARELRKASESESYRSTHFEQPNILAHMRVNDRVVDGKKTLFIEEVQSDWHQAGRKKGYGPQTETTHEAYYTTPDGQRVSLGFGATQEEAAAAVDPGWKNIVDVKFDTQTRKVSEGVPDAPFKTSWHELALKRAIQEASEKGYDKIAFTVGKTQVERYPEALRQVADDISWRAAGTPESGNRFIEIKKSGNTVLQAQVDNRGIVTSSSTQEAIGKPIEDLIGKPMGQQVIAEPSGSIKGEQFTVGGKGMEGFYDQILPKSLEKLGKKFDAKVGKSFIEGERTRDASGIPSMYPEKIEVWTMDITPKMRESVTTKGQPLFQFAPAIPAAGLLDYEER
jgi:hypothetical protein